MHSHVRPDLVRSASPLLHVLHRQRSIRSSPGTKASDRRNLHVDAARLDLCHGRIDTDFRLDTLVLLLRNLDHVRTAYREVSLTGGLESRTVSMTIFLILLSAYGIGVGG